MQRDRSTMTMSWPELLSAMIDGNDVDRADIAEAMEQVLAGKADPAALGGLLIGLRAKGEADEEILGLADAMLAAAEPLSVPPETVDVVGTGGSPRRRVKALNVSTMASFVAAAAGGTVCKHGNVAASSTSGSFDFLRELGVAIDVTPAEVERQLADHSLAFAFARTFHPAMRHAGPVRSALGVPTVFNVLGPLVHPGRVKRIVLGVADPGRAEQMSRVLASRQMKHALVVCGHGGLDELSTGGPSRVWKVTADRVEESTIDPADHGIALVPETELPGGSGADNASIFRTMVAEPAAAQPATDIVVLNAAAALMIGGVVESIDDGLERSRQALADGSVASLVDAFTGGIPTSA